MGICVTKPLCENNLIIMCSCNLRIICQHSLMLPTVAREIQSLPRALPTIPRVGYAPNSWFLNVVIHLARSGYRTEADFTGTTSTMHINHFPAPKLNFFHAVYSYSNLWMFLCYYQRWAISSTCFFWLTFYGSHSLNLHRLVVARSDKSLARFAFLY